MGKLLAEGSAHDHAPQPKESKDLFKMLETIAVILVVLWLLGFIGKVGGSLIHLLLVIAVVVFLFRFMGGSRPVA